MTLMDKLQAMRDFVAIVDAGSLTAAGTTQGRSLPTMVRSLKALEESLGARLLQRTTRRMSLTDEGAAYLARCRQILTDVEEAEGILTLGDAEPRGRLRVTASVLFGQMHVAPAVFAFLAAYPRVTVDLVLLDRNLNMVEEGLDVGIRIGTLDDSGMIAARIGEIRRVVCASDSLLARTGMPSHPTELADLPCVVFSGLTASATWRFEENGKPFRVDVAGPLACNQAAVERQACLNGVGFGTFLAYQVQPWIDDGTLQVVLEEFEPPPLPLSVVYPETRLLTPRVRAFIDWMKESLANPATTGAPASLDS